MRKREFQPILLENLRIRWPGFTIRRVALNQHMPRVERLGEHVHRFAQMLLYLRGEGRQHLGGQAMPVERGTVLVIPPGRPHRFEKTRPVRPICLVIDFESEKTLDWSGRAVMGARDLAAIERWLLALHEQQRSHDDFSIQTAALILRLLARLERAVNGNKNSVPEGPVAASVRSIVSRRGFNALTPGNVAADLGRTLDHLNRQLHAETGATTGGLLNQLRLDEATRLLQRSDGSVGDIAAAVGMDDQNYFSRWFRKQTGQTPTRWRAAMR
ncbi:MAG: helix-turn-helix domain-containing protein [Verrucomicrobiae bacterium]|nr:helix-turn-helix domain-containing protein [Verrucomicrobiae bacterium]